MRNPDAYDRALAFATNRGNEDGRAAASWYFDGNTEPDAYARVLRGIADGDPEILDTFPYADLSGQWADTLTGPQLVADALASAGLAPLDIPNADTAAISATADAAAEWFTDICDAYEASYSAAVSEDIETAARYQAGAS